MSDAETVIQPPSEAAASSGRSRRFLWFGIIIAVALIGVTFAVAHHSISQAQKAKEDAAQQLQKAIAGSRAEGIETWLAMQVEQTTRLVGSDLFQLFASEVDKLPGGVPLLFAPTSTEKDDEASPGGDTQAGQLSAQVPLMRTMLAEFVAAPGSFFSTGRIVNSKAEAYISTEATMTPLTTAQRKNVEQVVSTGRLLFAPIEIQAQGLVLDLYMPIMPPRYQQQTEKPVAVIILSLTMEAKLSELLLIRSSVEDKARSIHLIQKNGEIYQNVAPGMTQLRHVPNFPLSEDSLLPFALRNSFSTAGTVYSSGVPVRSADWWVVVEYESPAFLAEIRERTQTTYILAGLISVALALLVAAVWWWLLGREQVHINAHITSLLSVIEEQKALLDGINSTITDPISLTDSKGVYKYVNSAFASAVGRSVNDVVGLDSPAVFGFDTAKRLSTSDQHVMMTGESISVNELLWLQSKRYYFQISKTPLLESGSRTPLGIVSVFRDITKLVETQERSRRVVQQTIDALVRTIEESDPFLGGHSRIMSGIALLIAKQMRLSDEEVATVEAAANLSQIGKMFVPRDILLKPGALTPEEKQEMERHVEHTRNVLKNIEFDLPVLEGISQMNERLDGRGYPKGLAGDEISIFAKVLAVANAFTAMARPRSYRAALPVAEVLAILAQQSASYDQEIVASLREILNSPAGERLVQQAATSKAI